MIPYVIIAAASVIGLAVNGVLGALMGAGLASLGCAVLGSVLRAAEGPMDRRIRHTFIGTFWVVSQHELRDKFPGMSDTDLIAKVSRAVDAIAEAVNWGSAGVPRSDGSSPLPYSMACRLLADQMRQYADIWLIEQVSEHMARGIEVEEFIAYDWRFGKASRRAGQY